MDPKLAKRLMEVPEMKEFVHFLDSEASKLDKSSDIVETDPIKVAVEVMARKIAYKKIMDILEPLVNSQVAPSKPISKEYAIDVDDLDQKGK